MTIGHLATVREKINGLRKLEKALVGMAAECSQGDVPRLSDSGDIVRGAPNLGANTVRQRGLAAIGKLKAQ